ncbi:uncharacterized protein MYCFIDRAFT_181554 [Pseudocercospora fijiensis CIRAD86]|uniref:Uncharacterized protein n=1 Tax=Pseudocercospora fijiensis (strain CIRAD86) TaxID=383855 RepID=N1QCY9_PSEFD|nr:uncharacterized protein MYCFIDRAFT_181554 [Pseudocercospora fijiensis CIRAD86]EME89468.1 hypothetical protein MYCFIDRAFT_181554 [Pseudocercospora fijiensis CIRAD86]
MEGVEFDTAGEEVVYDGPDGEPTGGDEWRRATATANTLRLPLYPSSAADRRRRRGRPQA